jgi:hypothetical protein
VQHSIWVYMFMCSIQYGCICSCAAFNMGVYVHVQHPIWVYMFMCSIQYGCICSCAAFNMGVYVHVQHSIWVYMFMCSIQYGCICTWSVLFYSYINVRENRNGQQFSDSLDTIPRTYKH